MSSQPINWSQTWSETQTVLLDMDGTLLDLHYDNTLWSDLLPQRYAQLNQLSKESAAAQLFDHMQSHRGQLKFYCLDYWAEFTGLDVIALHHELADKIRLRDHAAQFVQWLKDSGKHTILATNAHRDNLAVKHQNSGIADLCDATVSCHDYGAPKEHQAFWQALCAEHKVDPNTACFIDDNEDVLNSAAQFGIKHLFTISQPDSARAPRTNLKYPIIELSQR